MKTDQTLHPNAKQVKLHLMLHHQLLTQSQQLASPVTPQEMIAKAIS